MPKTTGTTSTTSEDTRPYVEIAEKYARDVVSGKIPACRFVIQACQRQIDDRAREAAGKFEYTFNEKRAIKVCRFLEKLPHVKDFFRKKEAGKLITLEPWQIFILTTVFGWIDSAGHRRFRVSYKEVPRKNSKTTTTAGVALYAMALDGELGPEVVTCATKSEQARIPLDIARKMVEKTPKLREKYGLDARQHVILRESDAASFKALSKDNQGSQDGQNIHLGIIEEFHAHKTRDMFGSVDTGTGSRAQPLIWIITTAGTNRAGVCYEQRDYVKKVLAGTVKDERTFGIIYTIDEPWEETLPDGTVVKHPGDDWTTEEAAKKANPNYGISVNPEDLRRKRHKAINSAASQTEYKTKHLNCWENAATAWMNMVKWEACGNPTLNIEDFEGKPCDIGLDLATKLDIVAKTYLFTEDGVYTQFNVFYLPDKTVEESENAQYKGWVESGYIETTDGPVIDFDRIESDLREDANRFQVVNIAYDPWQATQLAQNMLKDGAPMIEYRPTVMNFSEPMKQAEALVLDRRLQHPSNPVMDWMVSNVVCKKDKKDNVFPFKEFDQNKIDGPVSLFMALGVQLKREIQSESYLDSNEVPYVG